MAEKPSDLYGTFGSVPSNLPQGGGGTPISARASPDDFGAQVGGAVSKAGATAEQFGNQLNDLAIKTQGMVNETLATNAEADYLAKSGQKTGEFRSLTGLEAAQALPQYTKDIQDLRTQMRQSLPAGANRAFDLLTVRHEGYSLNDANIYVAGQTKKAQQDAGLNLVNASAIAAGMPDIANNDQRFDEHLGSIKYGVQMQMDDATGPGTGLKEHPETGAIDFDQEAPEGKAAKANYENAVNYATGLAWQNRLNTISNHDPAAAASMYEKWKDRIPPEAQVRIESSLAPKLTNAQTAGIVGTTLNDAAAAHRDTLLNPPAKTSDVADAIHMQESRGRATSKTSVDGAQGGWQIKPDTFAQYAKPGEDIKNPADNEAVGRRIVDALKNKFPDDPARVAVGYFSGPGNVAPAGSKTPWLHDYKDGNGKLVSSYVSDVTSRMGPVPSTLPRNYATNDEGAPMSLPDYYAAHKDDIITKGDEYAERTMPGSLEFKNMVRSRLTNQMDTAISAQSAQYKQERSYVQKGITGALSNGKPPNNYEELRNMPGMADILDRAAVNSPEYYKGIDTQISKMASRDNTQNSPNGYETLLRVLEPNDEFHPNRIASQDHLDKLMGRSDGTGINFKDYNDGKKALEFSDDWKQFLHDNLKQISSANGNLDGQGQQRAIAFYNLASKLKDQAGDKGEDPMTRDAIGKLTNMYMPSRSEQNANVAKAMRNVSVSQNSPSRQPGETPEAYLQRTGL